EPGGPEGNGDCECDGEWGGDGHVRHDGAEPGRAASLPAVLPSYGSLFCAGGGGDGAGGLWQCGEGDGDAAGGGEAGGVASGSLCRPAPALTRGVGNSLSYYSVSLGGGAKSRGVAMRRAGHFC